MKKIKFSFRKIASIIALVTLIFVGVISSSPLNAQAVIEGYKSDDTLQRGEIIGLKIDDPSKIEAISLDQSDRMHGVTVQKNDAAVTISSQEQTTYVAKSGRFEVLVSDQNGPIHSGDFITASAVAGIGMKADPSHKAAIGQSLQEFESGKSTIVSTATLTSSNNSTKSVNIGRVFVELGVGKNPVYDAPKAKSSLPSWLQHFAESVAGREVNPLRVYIALGIFSATTVIAGSLLFSAVRNSLISIGRNPLSKKSIIRGLIQVVVVSIIIFIIGCVAVYLLLKI